MLTKTKSALAAVLILGTASGILGTASGALASQSGNDSGFVMPGSMDGVNPAYHPKWFPNYARGDNGAKAYGYVHTTKHARTQTR